MLNDIEISNYNELCRLCLKKNNENNALIDLMSDIDLIQKFIDVTTILVERHDLLPKRICLNCQKLIIYFYDYRQLCIKNDNLIKLHLKINANYEINEKAEKIQKDIEETAHINIIPNENIIQVIKNKHNENIEVKTVKRKRGRPFKSNEIHVPANEILNDELTKRKSLRSRKVNPLYMEFVTPLDAKIESELVETTLTVNLEQQNTVKKAKRKNKRSLKLPDLSPEALEEFKKKSKTIPQESHKYLLDPTLKKPIYYYSVTTKCNICYNVIPRKEYKYHINIHNNVRPYKCEICDKDFHSPYKRARHQNYVHSKNLIACDLCGVQVKNEINLQRHKNTVHLKLNEKSCKICLKKFTTSESLKRHMLKHLNKKNFTCDLCDKKFYTKTNLKIHLLKHTKEKLFKCIICCRQFGYKFVLLHHLKRIHNDYNYEGYSYLGDSNEKATHNCTEISDERQMPIDYSEHFEEITLNDDDELDAIVNDEVYNARNNFF